MPNNEHPLEPEVPTPPPNPNAPPPPPDDDDEGDAPPQGDPVKALHAERGKRKETARQLKAAKDELARVKPMADEYATILPVLPELLANAQRNTPPSNGNQSPQVDPEVLELAQDLNLVTEDGQYDIPRAARLMQRLDARSGRVAASVTQPIRANSAAAVATQVREKAYKAVGKDGEPYATKAAIDQVFNSLPPEALSDPNTAVMALVIARGLGGPGVDAGEPIHVEGPGRSGGKLQPLTQMERSIAKMRGKTEAEWNALATEAPADWTLEDA